MDVTGGGTVAELRVEDELHHEAEDHEVWQDSVVLAWWDLERGVGGYHRIGQHPNHPDGPRAHLCNAFFAADCVYKRSEFIPIRAQDVTERTFGCGDDTVTFEFTDHASWRFDQKEVTGELHITDFHPPVDIYPKTGQLADRITTGHLEVGGAVRGEITLNGTTYQIDGLAFRDHGWGKRYYEDFVCHRWIAATFGPELTVLAVSVLGTSDAIADFGCVIRDNTLTYADKIDILTYLEHDGITHRGGRLRMDLPGGEVAEFDIEPLQKGAVSMVADVVSVTDTMSRITWGDKVGICDFEISNNPGRGRHRPRFAINGITEDGLHLL